MIAIIKGSKDNSIFFIKCVPNEESEGDLLSVIKHNGYRLLTSFLKLEDGADMDGIDLLSIDDLVKPIKWTVRVHAPQTRFCVMRFPARGVCKNASVWVWVERDLAKDLSPNLLSLCWEKEKPKIESCLDNPEVNMVLIERWINEQIKKGQENV